MENLKVLLLSRLQLQNAQTVVDHIFSFTKYSEHDIYTLSWVEPGVLTDLDLNAFDAIVIHYSVVPFEPSHLSEADCEKIRKFEGLKLAFRQDEYQKVSQYYNSLLSLGIDLLFTCIPKEHIEEIYPEFILTSLKYHSVLTGYVPENLAPKFKSNIANRPIKIGYRGRACPFWYGDLGYDKIEIANKFTQFAKHHNLTYDISNIESERLYGEDWYQFIQNCQCMLGTESGVSVIDYNGELEQEWIDRTNSPYTAYGVTQFTYEQYRKKYLSGIQEPGIFNQISPRIFEAACLGTALILKEGRYSDIIEPNKHYISVKSDYSNFDDILAKINDLDYLQQIASTLYDDVIKSESYTFERFIREFDYQLDQLASFEEIESLPYSHDQFNAFLITKGYKNVAELIESEKQSDQIKQAITES